MAPSGDKSGNRSGGRTSGGAPRKYSKSAKPAPRGRNMPDEPIPGDQSWGGLARKGVLRVAHDDEREYEERDRPLRDDQLDPEELAKRQERDERRRLRDLRTEELRQQARTAVERAAEKAPKRTRAPRPTPAREREPLGRGASRSEDEVAALNRLLGPKEAKKQLRKLKAAAASFEAERYPDAQKSLKAITNLVPTVPEVRELYGLTLYRMGKFRAAAKELEVFRELAGSTDENPVLADCYRAQKRWADVRALWEELAEASPGAELVNEGRIVMAGALADQGDLQGAVRLLQKGWKRPKDPRDYHLRRAYALADLYEQSGDLPRARGLFDWVVSRQPNFVDARTRLKSLR